jgi:hypothetical protein
LDVQTGTNLRKARYVKEAEQNAAGLLSVLHDLRSGKDEDAVRTFLTFCDIPLALGSRTGLRLLLRSRLATISIRQGQVFGVGFSLAPRTFPLAEKM